jgi:hypothetical protein
VLGSPIGAVVGATDVEASAAFLADFDLAVVGRGSYGVDLASAERGRVRVVPAPPGSTRGPYDGGLAALDFYTRSVDGRPSVRIDLGPLVMHQARVTGPDGLPVVLIEANHRRPSRLDTTDAVYSEAHSLVWVVPDVGESVAFFVGAGLALAFDLPLESPAVSEVMGLPETSPVRMAMVSDAALSPMRLELFGFPGRSTPPAPAVPVAGGAWPAFEVEDLDAALDLPWQSVGEVADGTVRCVAPGGVLVELWA